MLLIRFPLIKRRPLKSVSVIDNSENTEFSFRYTTYNKADSILALYYKTKVTL